MKKYEEIQQLYVFCLKIGVPVLLKPMFDGYALIFRNGSGDFVQHFASRGSECGCVEPAIGCRLDYTAVELKNAIDLIRRHKDKLTRSETNET